MQLLQTDALRELPRMWEDRLGVCLASRILPVAVCAPGGSHLHEVQHMLGVLSAHRAAMRKQLLRCCSTLEPSVPRTCCRVQR